MSVVWVCLIQVSTGRSILDDKDEISYDLKKQYQEESASSIVQQYAFSGRRAGIIVFEEDSSEEDFGDNSNSNNPLPLSGAPSLPAQPSAPIVQEPPTQSPSHPVEVVNNKPSHAEILSPDHETTTPTRVERSILQRIFEPFKLLLS